MKTLKQTLSTILSVLMIVSVFSVIPLTAGAATISSIEIYRLFEPAAGNTFDDTAVCKTSGYTIDHISWYDYSNNKWMTWSDRFVEGTVYEVNVNVKAKDGNSFADMSSVTGTINSYNATVGKVTMEDPEQYLNLSYKFTAAKANTVVSSVAVSGVNAPVAGSKLDFSYNDSSSLYTIDAFEWRNPNNDGIYGKSYVAEENTSYQARFYLVPKTGYKFANDISGTINGFDAEVCSISGYKTYERTVVTYNFTTGEIATEPDTTAPATYEPVETTAPQSENAITNIGVVSVVEPEIGEKANDKAYPFYGSPFNIQSVAWYNKTDGYLMMIGDDKFEANKTYTARVIVGVNSGYAFNNPSATINEKAANTSKVDGYDEEIRLLVTRDFSTPAQQSDPDMITDVNITGVVEPVEGQTPSLVASGEDKYFVEAVTWYNCTDSVAIDAPETFEKGKKYAVNVFLRPHAGYRFNYDPKNMDKLDINATVNGQAADSYMVTGGYGGKYVEVNCSFIATEADTKETTAPAKETTAPVQETTAPVQETTAPVEETTAPATETTAPVEETTAPVDPQHNHNWGEWILVKRATMDEDGMEQRSCLDDPSHVETHAIPRINGAQMEKFKFTYTGEKINPAFTVIDVDGNLLIKDVDYKVTYYNTVNAGVYIADIEYIGFYEGGDSIQYIIAPAKNTVKVTAKNKSLKIKALSKKKQTVKALTVKNAKGSVTYAKVKKGSSAKLYKKVSVNKKGVITVKKGKYKKGTYKLKVKVTAKGTNNYESKSVTKTIKIKIK
ncbi:MAG: hypothetical protein IJ903_00190 [Ruminococcus sp.]|nr:hypothetical protein [Ruminococcus sp.]